MRVQYPDKPERPERNAANYASGYWLLAEAPRLFPRPARPPRPSTPTRADRLDLPRAA